MIFTETVQPNAAASFLMVMVLMWTILPVS